MQKEKQLKAELFAHLRQVGAKLMGAGDLTGIVEEPLTTGVSVAIPVPRKIVRDLQTAPTREYYDAYYVMHASLLMDIKIILKTIAVIFKGEEKFLHPVTEKQYAALKREIKIKYSSNTIICAELKLQGANK